MSERINDGGPAFPQRRYYRDSQGIDHEIHETGLSLRDYFAGQALAGIAAAASPQAISDISGGIKMGMREARAAYAWADAMIAAREGGKQ